MSSEQQKARRKRLDACEKIRSVLLLEEHHSRTIAMGIAARLMEISHVAPTEACSNTPASKLSGEAAQLTGAMHSIVNSAGPTLKQAARDAGMSLSQLNLDLRNSYYALSAASIRPVDAVTSMRAVLKFVLDLERDRPKGPAGPAAPQQAEGEPQFTMGQGKMSSGMPVEGAGNYRDWTIISEEIFDSRFASWWDQRVSKRTMNVNANAQLTRALTATKRSRVVRHPDGDSLDFEALPDLGARVPDPNPFAKAMNKAVTPNLLILIDQSGSMSTSGGGDPWSRMQHANAAATMIAKSAVQARCPFAVVPYEEDAHYAAAVTWKPGKPVPKFPIAFDARGGNDLMGATLQAAHWYFKGPRDRERRICISICDGDMTATGYMRGYDRHSHIKSKRRPYNSQIGKSPGWIINSAVEDMRDLPMMLGVEAHAISVAVSQTHWERCVSAGRDPHRPEDNLFGHIIGAFASVRNVETAERLPLEMSRLAAEILQPTR
jgi:Mg-chelatase subunit ChlD